MTVEIKMDSEKKILEAARKVFYNKGFYGARMQEIADEAEINKAMLHYYYRNKEKLFRAVFTEAFKEFVPDIKELLNRDIPLPEKIDAFVKMYIDILIDKPYVPGFILHELSRDSSLLRNFFENIEKPDFTNLSNQLLFEAEKGNIIKIEPLQFIVNMLSLCIFPIVSKPMLQAVFGLDDISHKEFVLKRKEILPGTIYNSIRKRHDK